MTIDATSERALRRVADLIREEGPTGKVGVLTGAGVSVPSGIPDFRSPGGIWERYPPEEYATIDAFRADPVRVWGFLRELEALVGGARPNPAHEAIAALEEKGFVGGVVTQNVDGLHQRAGSKNVVELHGSGDRLHCIVCGSRRPAAEAHLEATSEPPRCPACGAIEKPDVVMFGELLPAGAFERALDLVERCELWLVAGTSALVQPAASIPVQARARGAYVCELNLEPSLFAAEIRIPGDVAETLPRLADLVS